MIEGSEVNLTAKNMTLKAEEVFLLLNTGNELPLRDLYTIGDQDKDDSFHLDIVKEP